MGDMLGSKGYDVSLSFPPFLLHLLLLPFRFPLAGRLRAGDTSKRHKGEREMRDEGSEGKNVGVQRGK